MKIVETGQAMLLDMNKMIHPPQKARKHNVCHGYLNIVFHAIHAVSQHLSFCIKTVLKHHTQEKQPMLEAAPSTNTTMSKMVVGGCLAT